MQYWAVDQNILVCSYLGGPGLMMGQDLILLPHTEFCPRAVNNTREG